MKTGGINTKALPGLNKSIESALALFAQKVPPIFRADAFHFPIVVGSGNAINAGRIIFSDQAALFADESDLKSVLKNYRELFAKKIIKDAIVISASGEKDSVWEIEELKKVGLKVTLLTCSKNSSATKIADKLYVFDKLPEPYTYNVSTYLGMIIASNNEKAYKILNFIQKLVLPENFHEHSAYAFVLPDEFKAVAPMLEIKRHELFGPHLSLRAFSYGEARHAKFVIPWEKEMVISLGKNPYFGLSGHRFEIKLPKDAGNGLVMAICYFLVGLIQDKKPQYYRKKIANYCKIGPKAYGQKGEFQVIVD